MTPFRTLVSATLVILALVHAQAHGRVTCDGLADAGTRRMHFVENLGQWATPARFVARQDNVTVWIEDKAICLQVAIGESAQSGAACRMVFENAAIETTVAGIEPAAGLHHFFYGNDPKNWHTGARGFGGIKWSSVQDGIDVVLYQMDDHLEYDLVIDACADVSKFVVRCEGADGIEIDTDGRLLTRIGDVIIEQPIGECWQTRDDGTRIPRQVRFRKMDAQRFGFEVIDHDPEMPLVIDPGLVYSTYLGSASMTTVGDVANKLALDAQERPVITGWAAFHQFPITMGVYSHPSPPTDDVFVTKFSADGSVLEWSTLIGGLEHADRPQAITVDDVGNVIVGGTTQSTDFPTTPNAIDPLNEQINGFVFKLSPNGDQLIYSTFLGTAETHVYGLDSAPSGAVLVTGDTFGIVTTPGVYQPIKQPGREGFLCRISPLGNVMELCTYLGGSSSDFSMGVRADSSGAIVLVGYTGSTNLPTTPGVLQPTYAGNPGLGAECFIAKFNPNATSLLWLTYLGGTFNDATGGALAIAADDSVIFGGATASLDFPLTPGSYRSGPVTPDSPLGDAFVARVAADGTHLIYAALVASHLGNDTVFNLDADPSGTVTATGGGITGFPITPGAHDSVANGIDVSLFRLNPSGSRLLYSTFVGLDGPFDYGLGVVVHDNGRATVCGQTEGQFPVTSGAFDTSFNGGQRDGIVFQFDFQPTGVEVRGTSTPGCRGPITMGAVGLPMNPTTMFWLYASNAPPMSPGILVVGTPPPNLPIQIFGVPMWIDPAQRLARVGVQTDEFGYVETQFPVAAPAGTQFSAQYLFRDVTGCAQLHGLVSSHALTITVQ